MAFTTVFCNNTSTRTRFRIGNGSGTRLRVAQRRGPARVRVAEEDAMLPLFRLPQPETPPETLPRYEGLGGQTIGEELMLIREQYKLAEQRANSDMREDLYSDCWQGDVYVGSNNNIMTWLLITAFATPLLGLLFAWLSYGTLWTGIHTATMY